MANDELEVDLELTDPRAGHRPTPAILKDLGGDEKTVRMEAAAKEDYLAHLRSSADKARKIVEGRLDSARPRRARAEEDLERALEREREEFGDKWGRKVEWLQQRAKQAEKKLPELTGGPASPVEDDVRRWVREANDPYESQARIREIVEDGPDEARRALLRSDLPPGAAGFPTSDHRQRALREALRRSDPEAFETAQSVRQVVGQLATDLERFYEAQAAIRNRALREFDRFVDGS